ncbi:N-acetyltransferase GCN5 [Flavobacterium limnosediminis JC2902]|uniref:N-acetyltransferase GCN5 n=1 Tax=Flavobacterium limnosediminis JC2902 TaxID=1341181 RepID=V6SIT0_9FLAO|nr:N-acetyltransferase [Flavobacterium limnosediminis]ESU26359.1 N-acetyltransferase GCN5 [Flavobacterium limnosediminis JC2902]
MEIRIRQENQNDYPKVHELIEAAFRNIEYSDHKEHFLVERLRKSDAFIPELSLVAEIENEIVGHILLTRLRIENQTESFESLALAPVSVKPEFHGKGIGSRLITESHSIAKRLGYTSIILIGHKNYYPRFGYEPTSKYGIKTPFNVPEENCMIVSLTEKGLLSVRGEIKYPKEFFE